MHPARLYGRSGILGFSRRLIVGQWSNRQGLYHFEVFDDHL